MGNKKTKQLNTNKILPTFEFDIPEWKNLLRKLQKNKTLERFALSIKRDKIKNENHLASLFLNYDFKNDFEKAWLIYIWIANNISFIKIDVSKNFNTSISQNVLKTGSCDSQGYSCLFLDLSKFLNLNCIQINGYAKGFGYKIGDKFKSTDHYWNLIQLNNNKQWYSCDVSWGSGYFNNEFNFIKKFNPHWFLTPSQLFIYTHYSELNQIQSNKITLDQFENLPLFKLEYHLMDFKCCSNNLTSINNINKNPFNLEFLVPKQVTTIVELKDKNGISLENTVLIQRSKDQTKYELNIILPLRDHLYELNMFANNNLTHQRTFDLVAKFDLIRNDNDSEMEWLEKEKFISIFSLKSIEFYVYSPVKLNLKINKNYLFKIYVNDGFKVALIFNEINWIYLNNTNSIWSISRSFDSIGQLKLVISTLNNKSDYKILCFYSIIT
jgi:hypothetical protein